jgi:ABC-type transport system involved in cytochrome bd biosynthesis fused ATPase/permease subunit
MNRLYHIQHGAIKIDDVNIEAYKLDALRKNIGVVLQDVFLFSGSVLDNITLRNPAISREQVIAAAKMIDMHDFIMQLPGNYDYNVMERGGSLSLGQRQLLSFIRALLYNPSILILDEATSSVDTESEDLPIYGGSKSLRDAIMSKKYNLLMNLHGHIHAGTGRSNMKKIQVIRMGISSSRRRTLTQQKRGVLIQSIEPSDSKDECVHYIKSF